MYDSLKLASGNYTKLLIHIEAFTTPTLALQFDQKEQFIAEFIAELYLGVGVGEHKLGFDPICHKVHLCSNQVHQRSRINEYFDACRLSYPGHHSTVWVVRYHVALPLRLDVSCLLHAHSPWCMTVHYNHAV